MNIILSRLKQFSRYVVIVICAIILEVALGNLSVDIGFTSKLVAYWGYLGGILSTVILIIVLPVTIVAVTVGVIGGLWLDEKPKIGFILGTVFALPRLVGFVMNAVVSNWKISNGLIVLIACFLIIIIGGIVYTKVYKWKANRKE